MKKTHIEVIHEGEHCIPCVYMALLVEEVVQDYKNTVTWEKVILTTKDGAIRFDKLGQKRGQLPPVPSIYINGELFFDVIPGKEELREAIDRLRLSSIDEVIRD